MKEMVYTTTPKREWLMHSFYRGVEFVIMSLGTHPTAYVGITKDNPLYGKDYSDDDFPLLSCNGGITYTEPSIRNEDGKSVGMYKWWIGCDYNHCWDYNPKLAEDFELFSIDFTGYSHKKWTTEEIYKEVKEVIDEILGEKEE